MVLLRSSVPAGKLIHATYRPFSTSKSTDENSASSGMKEEVVLEHIKVYLRIRPAISDVMGAHRAWTIAAFSPKMTGKWFSLLRRIHGLSVMRPTSFHQKHRRSSSLMARFTRLNYLIFTYGVTNSGKTYTALGDHQPANAGILSRSLEVVYIRWPLRRRRGSWYRLTERTSTLRQRR